MPRLSIVPVSYREAAAFVREWHRHQPYAPTARGHQFSLGLLDGPFLVGVVMVHRPASRTLQGRGYLEVARLCTNGSRNACSRLYAAAWREVRGRGGKRLGTYTLGSESGASLRAAVWVRVREVKARTWDTPGRRRTRRPLSRASRVYWVAPRWRARKCGPALLLPVWPR